jgi:hypothetical protein
MRYGYQSQWFGEGAMRQKASTVAQRLLLALRRRREVRTLSVRDGVVAIRLVVTDLARTVRSVHCSL